MVEKVYPCWVCWTPAQEAILEMERVEAPYLAEWVPEAYPWKPTGFQLLTFRDCGCTVRIRTNSEAALMANALMDAAYEGKFVLCQ